MQSTQNNDLSKSMDKLIDKIYHDPLLIRKLCDRIDDLMQEELQLYQEWTKNYWRI